MIFQNKALRYGLLAVFVLLGGFWLISDAKASTFDQAVAGTYKLYDNGRGNCSAIAVSKNQLVTAAHCVSPRSNLSLQIFQYDDEFEITSGSLHGVKILRTMKDQDVAMLELKDQSVELQPVDVADNFDPKIGDELYAFGYPKAMDMTVTTGMFTGTYPLKDLNLKGGFYKTTIPITGGNSGGGLFRETDGNFELVGLATASFRDVSFMSYFSLHENLKKVMVGLLNKSSDKAAEILDVKKPEMSIDLR